MALGEVTIYVNERCWRQVGGGVKEFVVPHSPPRVIEGEGTNNLGDEGTDVLGFLDWARDYPEWWATQSYGPLEGPVEPPVSAYIYIYIYFKVLVFYLDDFDSVYFLFRQAVAAQPPPVVPSPPAL